MASQTLTTKETPHPATKMEMHSQSLADKVERLSNMLDLATKRLADFRGEPLPTLPAEAGPISGARIGYAEDARPRFGTTQSLFATVADFEHQLKRFDEFVISLQDTI